MTKLGDTEMEVDEKLIMDIETGQIRFNVFDLISNLSDEQKDALVWDQGYWAFMSDKLKKEFERGFSSNSYNAIFMKFRQSFLTADSMFEMIRAFCQDLIRSFAFEYSIAQQDRENARKLENIVRDYFDDHRSTWPKPTKEQVLEACRFSHHYKNHGEYAFASQFAQYFMDEFVKNNPEIQLPSDDLNPEDL